jgi:tetratricopeptide (TPR) repeat protein
MGYTWQKTVEATAAAYEEVLNRIGRRVQPQQYTVPVMPEVSPSSQPAVSADFQNILERGENAAMNEQYATAHELLAQAESMQPASARALKARGTVFLVEGNIALARGYFERAHRADSRDPRPMSGLGMCELREQRHSQAYEFFRKALDIDPMHLTSILQLMECSYVLGKFDDLERILRRYLSERGSDTEMSFCLAGCCFKQGKMEEASRIVAQVLREKPEHTGARELETVLRQKMAAPPSVQQRPNPVVNSVVQSAVDVAQPVFDSMDQQIMELEEAKRERRLGDVKSGCSRLATLSTLKPAQREKVRLLQAETFVLEEDLVSAREIYDSVLRDNPASARALCGHGALAAHANRWEEARRSFEQALYHKPEYDVALAGMGLCCSWFKDHERAWDFYKRAVRANPENARALLGIIELGYPLKRLGDVEEAVRAYLDMHPLDFEFLYALAGCLFAQGKLDEATAEVRKITMFEPNNERARELQRLIDERESTTRRASTAAGR